MSNYITTHSPSGHSILSHTIPTPHHPLPLPFGHISMLYSTTASPPNISTDADIDAHAHIRDHGFPEPGQICPPNGTSAAMIAFQPGAEVAMHRTATMGYMVFLEGVMEMRLEGEEAAVTLRVGDTLVVRAGMHAWRNVSPEGGWVKAFAVAMGVQDVVIGGKKLEPVRP